jgi:hypothetical protein
VLKDTIIKEDVAAAAAAAAVPSVVSSSTVLLSTRQPHHAEGLVDPNLRNKKTVTGFRYPRACRFRKYQFENRSTFFKT